MNLIRNWWLVIVSMYVVCENRYNVNGLYGSNVHGLYRFDVQYI